MQQGRVDLLERLEGGPDCPEPLAYLVEWLDELHRRSGVTEHGYSPLSWPALAAWSQFTGNVPERCECDALFLLDTVRLNPGEWKEPANG